MTNRIRDIRKAKGLTLADLAAACDPPTTAQTIGRLETGMRQLSLTWMNRIAAALGVEPASLMRAETAANTGRTVGSYTIAMSDDFTYVDPVDGSVSSQQGMRFLMVDGSRIIFRLSGTAGSGATVRMYIEQYEPKKIDQVASEALAELIRVALDLCDIKGFLGTEEPTVIT